MSFLTKNIDENVNNILSFIKTKEDIITRNLVLPNDTKASLIYMKGIVKEDLVELNLIKPLLFKISPSLELPKDDISKYISERFISCGSLILEDDDKYISSLIIQGFSCVLINGDNKAILCNTIGGSIRSVSTSTSEHTIRGGSEAFIEHLDTNLSLIKQKCKTDKLKIEHFSLGTEIKSNLCIGYLDGKMDEKILTNAKYQLFNLSIPHLADLGYLTQYIDKKSSIDISTFKLTEKPDKVISDLYSGKFFVLMDGCPKALIAPVTLIEFIQTIDDYSINILSANFNRLLRIIAAILMIFISPFYLAVILYNPEILPINLLKTIFISRQDMPLNPFFEILLVEIIIELLREGGIRLPSSVAQTLTVVSGIVFGDAAIRSGIISPATLFVSSIEVCASFVIPNYDLTYKLRSLKFILLISSYFLGFFGIAICTAITVIKLLTLNSFGVPFLSPIAPFRGSSFFKDGFIRAGLDKINKTPKIFSTNSKYKNKQKKQSN